VEQFPSPFLSVIPLYSIGMGLSGGELRGVLRCPLTPAVGRQQHSSKKLALFAIPSAFGWYKGARLRRELAVPSFGPVFAVPEIRRCGG
jgi:hypothetical protein